MFERFQSHHLCSHPLPLAVTSLQKIREQYAPLCITHRCHQHSATENVDKWGRPEVSASENILWVESETKGM